MRVLLDTHVVLWELAGSRTVSPAAREAIEQASDVLVSVVSFAEIGVRASIGKLSVPADLREHVLRSGVSVLGLDADDGLAVAGLPMHHRDPFDRLLVAQARSNNLSVISADRRIAAYDVAFVDAG